MKIDRTKRGINNIIFGCLYRLTIIIFPFIIRTIIINYLGVQYLGLNSLFSSILNILSLAELGFGTALVYSMYKPIAEDDTETVNALLNLYKKIYRIIGLIVLIVGICVMPFLKYFIKGSYPADINLYLLYSIFLLNSVIGYFFFAYKTSLLAASQRNDITSKISIVSSMVMYLCQILVLVLFSNYYVYAMFMPLSTFAINLFTGVITKRLYPQYFSKGKISANEKKVIKKQIYSLFLHRIGYVIQTSIDNICISAFIGLTVLGKFNNYIYIITAIQGFLTMFKQSLVAGVGNSLIVENKEYNKKTFYKLLAVNAWIVGWCSVCLLCLFQPFINIWVHTENMLPFTVVVCLVIMFFVGESRGIVAMYKDALGMWYEDRFKPISISLFNLVVTLICAYFGCLEGIILATAGGYLLVGFPWETHIFFKNYFKESKKPYYVRQLCYLVITATITGLTYFVCSLVQLNGVIEVVVKGVICLVVPNILYLIAFILNKDSGIKDKFMLKQKIKHFMGKCIIAFFKLFPIKKNRVYLVSNFGTRFACNPRAYFKYLYNNHKDKFEFYYCLNDGEGVLPKDVKHAKYLSIKDLYYLCTSKYIINNFRFHPYFSKRKSQIYIHTWHAGAFAYKMIEKDAPNLSPEYIKQAKNDSKYIDMLVVGSKQCQEVMDKCFFCDNKSVMSGNPRCDVLICGDEKIERCVRERYNITKDDYVVLYAPTFKVNQPLEESFLDNQAVKDAFANITNKNIKILYKFHPNIAKQTQDIDFGKGVINVTSYPDMQDLLMVADILITDYSSCMFDIMITGKPCIVYSSDSKKYLTQERGVYFSSSVLPFPVAENKEELLQLIQNLDNDKEDYKARVNKFIKDFDSIEDGHACERLYNFMITYEQNKKK